MHRFHVSPDQLNSTQCALAPPEAHHAISVLRIAAGELVEILDGAGGRAQARVRHIGKRDVQLEILQRFAPEPPLFKLVLYPALLKNRAMDWVLQKAVELGAFAIRPIQAQRSISIVDLPARETKLAGWRQTIIESARQCGATHFPIVDAPETVSALCKRSLENTAHPLALHLVASLESHRCCLWDAVEKHSNRFQGPPTEVGVWIGPEGDFTPDEYATLASLGAVPFELGPLTLRAETAALASCAILAAELRRRWTLVSPSPPIEAR